MISCGPANLTPAQGHEWVGLKAAYRNALELAGRAVTPGERADADQLAAACREALAGFWRAIR